MTAAEPPALEEPFVRLRGIVKRFGSVVALDGVELELHEGEVHALVGENGAGKTTLMQVLAGVHRPDHGDISVGEASLPAGDVEAAARAGVAMIHQHFMLFGGLTVAENFAIKREPMRRQLFDRSAAEREVRRLGEQHGLAVNPKARIADLSVGDLQRLEILRALYREARVLVFDEPTALLTPQETKGLLDLARELAAKGTTVVFISHKLDEVLDVASRITVLRDGRVSGRFDSARRTRGSLPSPWWAVMSGGLVRERVVPGPPALELRGVRAPGLAGVSLTVSGGEIVGVAGVIGNGQSELAEVVVGLVAPTAGAVMLQNRDATRLDVLARRDGGLAYIPDDRFGRGLAADASIVDNLAMGRHRPFRPRALRARARELIARFGIKAASERAPVRTLSGGNAQRVVLARELADERPVIVAAQPTRGIDIAATEFVHRELLERRRRGAAILLISSDLREILALSDRIVVMHRGRLAGEVAAADARAEQLGLWMAGLDEPREVRR